jgi:biotin-(acetyl-CoA carboxylase) ligase
MCHHRRRIEGMDDKSKTSDIYLELTIDSGSALFINLVVGIEHYTAQQDVMREHLNKEPELSKDEAFMNRLALCASMIENLSQIRDELKEQFDELQLLQSQPVKPRWST